MENVAVSGHKISRIGQELTIQESLVQCKWDYDLPRPDQRNNFVSTTAFVSTVKINR